MNGLTIIRLLDLRYYYQYKPETYNILIEKLKERLSIGETIELILDDSTSLKPANTDRLEKFLLDEIECMNKTISLTHSFD